MRKEITQKFYPGLGRQSHWCGKRELQKNHKNRKYHQRCEDNL